MPFGLFLRIEGAIWLDFQISSPRASWWSQSLLLEVFIVKQYFLEFIESQHVSNLSYQFVFKCQYKKNHISFDQLRRGVPKRNVAIMLTNASLKIQSAQQSNPLHLTILQAIQHYYGRNKSNKATKMTQTKSNEAIVRSKNKKQWSITIRETYKI